MTIFNDWNKKDFLKEEEKNDFIRNENNVCVAVRVRPLSSKELNPENSSLPVTVDSEEKLIRLRDKTGTGYLEFTFDHCFNSTKPSAPDYMSQEKVYNAVCNPLFDKIFNGNNVCVFAYGQTGSGKSHTMMGTNENNGIIPRFAKELISKAKNHDKKIFFESSYFEIYNEKIHDLLVESKVTDEKTVLRIREKPGTGPYVENLTTHSINTIEDLLLILTKGNKHKATASTLMNDRNETDLEVFKNLNEIEAKISKNFKDEGSLDRKQTSKIRVFGTTLPEDKDDSLDESFNLDDIIQDNDEENSDLDSEDELELMNLTNEEDNDNEYQSEDSESDNVDSDFDIDEHDEVIEFEDDEDKKRTRGRVITKAYKEPKRKTESVDSKSTKRLYQNRIKSMMKKKKKKRINKLLKPAVEIVSHFRNELSLKNFGFNQNVTWKPDSSMIIIQFAITLLNKAIEKGESNLVKDLNRFLNAIEPSELSKTTNTIEMPLANINVPWQKETPDANANLATTISSLQVLSTSGSDELNTDEELNQVDDVDSICCEREIELTNITKAGHPVGHPTQFSLIQILGEGSFGRVFLVKKIHGPDSGTLYAMKVLRKATLKGNLFFLS
ncbi:hypothetical protein RND71_044009 [Anisodus tanguticus]|uniref:Uncharacterized protein n=1 Tax=Anisodus tanguticus TaxID=243964 RepID=A0AAE1QPH8_9SOLA|nr:hypothetical protein RND71_044009 [Anisodus tanguticus]